MIRTVLGDIPPRDLGVTMCHEHLSLDLSRVRGDGDSIFLSVDALLPELRMASALGVKAIIEASTIDMKRDALALKALAQTAGLHIVASTGFYLQAYHPAFLADAAISEIAAIFEREITVGIDDTGVRAGLIAEVATSKGAMTPEEEKVLLAAGGAASNVGCAVSTHCDGGTLGLEQARLLKLNMPAEKVILGHLDLADDTPYHQRLLDEGVNIAFDTIGKTAYLSDERRADNLCALLERGYEDQLLLSQDISRLSYLTQNGGRGYTAVMGYFIPMLKERGVAERSIHKMLTANPARILDME